MPRFTDSQIRGLAPHEKTYRVMDEGQPGLGIEVRPNGRRAWIFRGQIAGTRRLEVIGDYPAVSLSQARGLARDRWAALKQNPSKVMPAEHVLTFGEVADKFLAEHGSTRADKTQLMYKTALKTHCAALRARPVGSITSQDIEALHRTISARSPTSANRMVAVCSKLFAWSQRHRMTSLNPAANIEKAAEDPRSRVLTDSELAQIWHACQLEGPIYAGVIRLLVLTGCRLAEIAEARWDELREISLDALAAQSTTRRVLRIPPARMKARREHVVVLSPEAVDVIESVRGYTASSPWIFPRISGDAPITDSMRYGTRRLQLRCQLEHWTHHDLRRTATTIMARLKIAPHLVEQMTAHAQRGVTWEVYNQYRFGAELAQGWDALGQFVARTVANNTFTSGVKVDVP